MSHLQQALHREEISIWLLKLISHARHVLDINLGIKTISGKRQLRKIHRKSADGCVKESGASVSDYITDWCPGLTPSGANQFSTAGIVLRTCSSRDHNEKTRDKIKHCTNCACAASTIRVSCCNFGPGVFNLCVLPTGWPFLKTSTVLPCPPRQAHSG